MEPFYMLEYEIKNVSLVVNEEWKMLYLWDLPEWLTKPKQITDLIEQCLSIGKIRYIDLHTITRNGKKIRYAFLYFDFWYDTMDTNYIKTKIQENKYMDIHGFLFNDWLFIFTDLELSKVNDIKYTKYMNTIGLRFTNDIISMC